MRSNWYLASRQIGHMICSGALQHQLRKVVDCCSNTGGSLIEQTVRMFVIYSMTAHISILSCSVVMLHIPQDAKQIWFGQDPVLEVFRPIDFLWLIPKAMMLFMFFLDNNTGFRAGFRHESQVDTTIFGPYSNLSALKEYGSDLLNLHAFCSNKVSIFFHAFRWRGWVMFGGPAVPAWKVHGAAPKCPIYEGKDPNIWEAQQLLSRCFLIEML